MKNQTKVLIYLAAVVILALGAFQYFSAGKINLNIPNFQPRSAEKPEGDAFAPAEKPKKKSVTVDFGNGQKLTGEVSTQSAYQALLKVAGDNNVKVETKQYKYGLMVTAVGDVASSAKAGWVYSVNGKAGQIAADRYVIYPGDSVLWEFKKF